MSTIDGKKVHNLDEHPDAGDFLKHPEHRHVAAGYLEEAAKHGKAEFFAGGKRYELRSKDVEGGKKEFSVHEHH